MRLAVRTCSNAARNFFVVRMRVEVESLVGNFDHKNSSFSTFAFNAEVCVADGDGCGCNQARKR